MVLFCNLAEPVIKEPCLGEGDDVGTVHEVGAGHKVGAEDEVGAGDEPVAGDHVGKEGDVVVCLSELMKVVLSYIRGQAMELQLFITIISLSFHPDKVKSCITE